MSATTDAFAPSLWMRATGAAHVAWTDLGSQLFGASWDPTSHAWRPQQQLTSSGQHDTAGVLVNAADGVVLGASAIGCPVDLSDHHASVVHVLQYRSWSGSRSGSCGTRRAGWCGGRAPASG